MFGLFVSIGEGLRFITKENSTGLRHLIGRAVSGASPLVSAAWFWCIRQDANHQVAGVMSRLRLGGTVRRESDARHHAPGLSHFLGPINRLCRSWTCWHHSVLGNQGRNLLFGRFT